MIPLSQMRNRSVAELVEPGRVHSAGTFARSTTATFLGPAGTLLTAASGAPRFEYSAAGVYLGLLMEEQRTNLLTYSGIETGIAGMTALNTTDAGISWLGMFTAGVQFGNNSITRSAYRVNHMNAVNVVYTMSVFVRMDDGGAPVFGGTGGGNDGCLVIAGQVASSPTTIHLGGGVYRVSATRSHTAPNSANGVAKFNNNSSRGFTVSGYQLEAAPFASSYIPTTTTSITRGADSLGFSSLPVIGYNASAGTLILDGYNASGIGAADVPLLSLSDGTADERAMLRRLASSTTIDAVVTDGGVDQFDAAGGAVSNSVAFRAALAWGLNDFAYCLNGGTVQTDGSGTLPLMDRLAVGAFNGHVRRARYFSQRRLNPDLQGLTA